jgi:hypothetical protein
MSGNAIVRTIGILCGIGALSLTLFFGWVLYDARANDPNDYGPQHYAGPISTRR